MLTTTANRPAVSEGLTYVQLADRIEQTLGVRPALSTLRAAAADSTRGVSRTRLTAGMPPPIPQTLAGTPARFDAQAVDRWLHAHPRRQLQHARRQLVDAPPDQRDATVAQARRHRLSWTEIAAALSQADSTCYSRQGVHQRYRHT